MSKIKKITIKNFKYFTSNVGEIELDGKHLLLYGENGSGKSSIYWALYTLFEASIKQIGATDKYFKPFDGDNNPESLLNVYANEVFTPDGRSHHDASIQVEDTNGNIYNLSLLDYSAIGDRNLQEGLLASDFLNYQSLYEITRLRNSDDSELNDVFCTTILPYLKFSPVILNGTTELESASDMWKTYKAGIRSVFGRPTTRSGRFCRGTGPYSEFKRFKDAFNLQMSSLMTDINNESKKILAALGYQFEIKLAYNPPKSRSQKYCGEFSIKLTAQIKVNGVMTTIQRPHKYFNEAKLVAIALAIRLAILKKRPSNDVVEGPKILALDDVMISLDMNNRDGLINLIRDSYLNDYQILMFTHDERLLRFLKIKFGIGMNNDNGKWKCLGICGGHDETEQRSDVDSNNWPILIKPNDSAFEKAKKYYKAGDYETASMWIRKSLETICAKGLPKELCVDKEGNSLTLNNLWKRFVELNSDKIKSIDGNILNMYESSRLAVLNPSAHYNRLSMPIYRKEVGSALKIVDKLWNANFLDKTLIARKGDYFIFKHPSKEYTYSFRLERDLILIGDDLEAIKKVKCVTFKWEYEGQVNYDFGVANLAKRLIGVPKQLKYLMKGIIESDILEVDEKMFLTNTMLMGKCSLSGLLGCTHL